MSFYGKITAFVIGYGMRGQAYAKYAIDNPEEFQIVGVAVLYICLLLSSQTAF